MSHFLQLECVIDPFFERFYPHSCWWHRHLFLSVESSPASDASSSLSCSQNTQSICGCVGAGKRQLRPCDITSDTTEMLPQWPPVAVFTSFHQFSPRRQRNLRWVPRYPPSRRERSVHRTRHPDRPPGTCRVEDGRRDEGLWRILDDLQFREGFLNAK